MVIKGRINITNFGVGVEVEEVVVVVIGRKSLIQIECKLENCK